MSVGARVPAMVAKRKSAGSLAGLDRFCLIDV